jgi:hypothetical protein
MKYRISYFAPMMMGMLRLMAFVFYNSQCNTVTFAQRFNLPPRKTYVVRHLGTTRAKKKEAGMRMALLIQWIFTLTLVGKILEWCTTISLMMN